MDDDDDDARRHKNINNIVIMIWQSPLMMLPLDTFKPEQVLLTHGNFPIVGKAAP